MLQTPLTLPSFASIAANSSGANQSKYAWGFASLNEQFNKNWEQYDRVI
jgi:hypothetical protein